MKKIVKRSIQPAENEKNRKKKRGHVAGSRYQNRTDAQNSNRPLMEKDPRIGSKKPISLLIDGKEEKP